MHFFKRVVALAVGISVVSDVLAGWTIEAKINQLNVGGNGVHGTFLTMEGVSFAGCANTTVALLKGDNLNYKEFISFLLAAKMTDKAVKLNYSGCEGSYSIAREIVIK